MRRCSDDIRVFLNVKVAKPKFRHSVRPIRLVCRLVLIVVISEQCRFCSFCMRSDIRPTHLLQILSVLLRSRSSIKLLFLGFQLPSGYGISTKVLHFMCEFVL